MVSIPRLAAAFAALLAASESYRESIEHWRQDHEAKWRADDGWLTLTGLIWLGPGRNQLEVGVFEVRDGKVTYEAPPGLRVTLEGRPVASLRLRPDVPGPPDELALGERRFHVIQRGRRLGVRLRDLASPRRRDFPGMRWFPVREEYRVRARFIPHAAPRTVEIPTVLGETERRSSPGYAEFALRGRTCRLEALPSGESELFFVFQDRTSGKETYSAGRYLYTDVPRDGFVELDFNKAYNPPCSVTPYATCPLPPPQNRLPVRIEAGELYRP